MSTIGILGAGQLGRMLALSGYPLGLSFRFLDLSEHPPAAPLGKYLKAASFTDEAALKAFAEDVDIVTFEFENVPCETLKILSQFKNVYPGVKALEVAQDRLLEKNLFTQLGIETPKYQAADTEEEFLAAVANVGIPCVVKTRKFGYDGKGQFRIREEKDVAQAWTALQGHPLIVESFVPFERELSVVAVRSLSGEIAWYPLTENVHREGILHISKAPAPGVPDVIQQSARGYVSRILRELEYVGVMALELFEMNGRLLANELAPRVHNSGHWTIDGAETSQFENHLRAILGLPLGSVAPRGMSAMVNLVGSVPSLETLATLSHCHIHLYDKPAQPKRKMGHITFTAQNYAQLEKQLESLPEALRA